MRIQKRMFILGGIVAISGAVTLSMLQRISVNGESDNFGGSCATAEPTPEADSLSDPVNFKQDKAETVSSTQSKEQLVEEALAGYNWTGREEEKEMFRQALMSVDSWETDDMLGEISNSSLD